MEVGAIPKTISLPSTISIPTRKPFPERSPNPITFPSKHHIFSPLSQSSTHKTIMHKLHFSPKSSFPVASAEHVEEPATNVKFQTSLSLPGLSSSLSLLGTGYREKVFAIIGVKVYAAGLYVNQYIYGELNAWKGRSVSENQVDSSLFESIFQVPMEKSLQIVLVRDIDGKTFWDALDEAVSPRIKARTPVDESTLSTFRGIFQGRALKKGTFIFLTWVNPAKMLVHVSSDGLPAGADATIDSTNVTKAFFDVFFGDAPVSPSLKASVAAGITTILN